MLRPASYNLVTLVDRTDCYHVLTCITIEVFTLISNKDGNAKVA